MLLPSSSRVTTVRGLAYDAVTRAERLETPAAHAGMHAQTKTHTPRRVSSDYFPIINALKRGQHLHMRDIRDC